jgi:response regulator NasT
LNTEQTVPVPKNLLLVDDDRLVLSTLATGLTRAGYRVTPAESAEEAEACLSGGDGIDLAIVDVRMPGRGGLHLAQRLRDLEHIPFMILSAYSDAQIVAQATHYGAMGYAVKPIDLPQLLPAIEAVMARADELQELRLGRQQLQRALDGDRSINIATGIIMVSHKLARADAFNMLRNTARSQRRKLADLAQDVIQGSEALSLTAPTAQERRRPVIPLVT